MASPQTTSAKVKAFVEKLRNEPAFRGQDALVYPSSPGYEMETKTWGVHRNMHPEVVVKPTTLEQIAPLTRLLYDSEFDFAVRNSGVGSTSARHVLVALGHLNTVSFDRASETVTVGAGSVWKDVNLFLAKNAPDWAVVSPRTSFVGVVGATLIGGLSYLSDEFGLVSDPQNLLDVQVALADGRTVWAAEEAPEVLWAVRGGRCAFGIVTALRLRARRLDIAKVYISWVIYPSSSLREVSRAISKHVATNADPYLSMTAYILSPNGIFMKSEPGVALLLFDRHGAEHARGPEGFGWALDIECAKEQASELSLHEINQQMDDASALVGLHTHFDATGLVNEIDEEYVMRANDWFTKVLKTEEFADASFCLLEFCGPKVFASARPEQTAWPHGKPKHVLQLGVGYTPAHAHLKSEALGLLADAFQTIPSRPLGGGEYTPTFLEHSIMDVKEMYGDNYHKLEQIAGKYDPKRRFRSLFNRDPNFALIWT